MDREKQSPYATWASVLLHTAPGARDGLELDLDWASNLAWTPLLDSYGGGQGGGCPRPSFMCSPSPWGVLQLGPKGEKQAHDDDVAPGRNSDSMS